MRRIKIWPCSRTYISRCSNNFQFTKLTTAQQESSHLTTRAGAAILIRGEVNSNSTSSRTCSKLVSSSCRIKHTWPIVTVKAWCSHSSKIFPLNNRDKRCVSNKTLSSSFKCSKLPRPTLPSTRTHSPAAHCKAQMVHLATIINWPQICCHQSEVICPITIWLKIWLKTTIQWLSSIRKTTWSEKAHLARCTQPWIWEQVGYWR